MTDRLLEGGHAYRCWCTAEELDERRKAALARGEPPGYDGRCRQRPASEIAAFEAEGRPFAIRFLMPERGWVVEDLVKGEVRWGSDRPPRLRDRPLRRIARVPAGRRRRRPPDGDHPRDPRRRPARERTPQRRGDRGARGDAARLRAPPAGPRTGLEAPVQAARRHERRRVPRARVPPRGDGQLPGAPRLGQGRSHDAPLPRRARRGVRSLPRLPQPGRVRRRRSSNG